MGWKHRWMKRKRELSMKTKNDSKISSFTVKAGTEDEQMSEVGEKWTASAEIEKKRGLGWARIEGCEVHGSLQSKQRLTEGLLCGSGWARGGDSNTGM